MASLRDHLVAQTSIQQTIAAGTPDAFDETQFAKLANEAGPGEATSLHYLAGRVLLRENQIVQAQQHLMQAASSTDRKLVAAMVAAVFREQETKRDATG